MDCNSTTLAYRSTGYFSKIILDYIERSPQLDGFYAHEVSMQGIADAISARQQFNTDRALLVAELNSQYAEVATSAKVTENIAALASENTFTICTAHQPVIFTGTLYFIYKILHTVKLAEECTLAFPGKRFVPVFYMGSEDADLEELGKIYMRSEKITWDTKQKGAVGRMKTKGLEKIIDRLEGEIGVLPYGPQLIALFRECYLKSADIQTATFKLIDALFRDFGVVVLIPDNPRLKAKMSTVFEDDLFNQTASAVVGKTTIKLEEHYKVQAHPREINLFYLKDDIRELILYNGQDFEVRNTDLRFSQAAIRQELATHPERFSPNVILRGLFQETILPNIAFIGGGGETAYWLELRDLFANYKTPFPLLILRNSFLIVGKQWASKLEKLEIKIEEIFQSSRELLDRLVQRSSGHRLKLDAEIADLKAAYAKARQLSVSVDRTLAKHVDALESRSVEAILKLEKKLLRAERRRFDDQSRQISRAKDALFPLNGLQERIDNVIPWYAGYGNDFLQTIYKHSTGLQQEFIVLTER
jgi:bacillithiol biosynthesis cysteine-adding enzyme BshC